jgi:hypothetical protein
MTEASTSVWQPHAVVIVAVRVVAVRVVVAAVGHGRIWSVTPCRAEEG